ncbi:MAG: phenylalanine--tRNA ligase subunit beta [Proteobacteria bacterium]|nr:phenylalanine--tRNA ligase subunit beta [Pseudomonadota bacterium]
MKISLNWVKEFVEFPDLSAEELARTITLSVCEVEGYEETGTHLNQVIVAEVTKIEPHPNADKLKLVTVNMGQEQKVVCGAQNFVVGDKIPYVGIGAVLPGGLKIKAASIRGVESCGMLCAEDELGFSDDHEGLMILPADSVVGTSFDQLFEDQVDIVLEIDNKSITHRPDLWGHYGFARELGTIFKTPLKPVVFDAAKVTGKVERIIEVEVKAPDLVPRFTGLSVSNVEVRQSSIKLQHRLTRVGLRPINNLVDLTNYVMLELGQPMHAFDAAQIEGRKLVVQLAEPGTEVMTLYNKIAKLGKEDLTICDANGPSVVAGVIGGLNSGVSDDTDRIFLEAANWNPVAVRKTATRIGIRTDACQRYEKSLDPEISSLAIQRSVELLAESCPELVIAGDMIDIRGKGIEPISIETTVEFINRRLGKEIEKGEITETLTRLGFEVAEKDETLLIKVPSFRGTKDVSIPEDLVEEVGRIHGFNNIKAIAPLFPIEKPSFNQQRRFERAAKSVLRKNGFHEVYNYPLTCQKKEIPFDFGDEGVMRLKNPVADNQDQMRRSLLPHFVDTIHENQKISMDFRIFEIGRSYLKEGSGRINEAQRLIAAVSTTSRKTGDAFYQLKSRLIKLLSRLQINRVKWQPIAEEDRKNYQHKAISAAIVSGKIALGEIYSFSPEYRDQFDIKGDVVIAELNFDTLFDIDKKEYKYLEPPKFPSVNFEVSVIVPERTFFQGIANLVKRADHRIIKADYLGVYPLRDKPGSNSLSISMEFQSPKKTLDSNEVVEIQDRVVRILEKSGYPLR